MSSPGGRVRRSTLFVTLWAFGFATTLLLIGMWGRSTSGDTATIESSTRAVLSSEEIGHRVYDWMAEGLEAAAGVPGEDARAALVEVERRPEAELAVSRIVDQTVAALLAQPGSTATIDVAESLRPLRPIVVAELQRRSLDVAPEQVDAALEAVDEITLDTGSAGSIASVASEVRVFLTWIVLLAGAGLLVFGAASIWLAEERMAMLRNLATRTALSAFSFFLLFQIGGWIADPSGGRSPVLTGSAIVVRSNGHVFALAAVIAGTVATAVAWFVWRARKPVIETDDTRELVTA